MKFPCKTKLAVAALAVALIGSVHAQQQGVFATATGVLKTPTTFFTANSAAILALGASTYQPLDSDLTAIAALATQTAGRSLLTLSAVPTGALVGTSDTQTLTGKSIDAGQLTGTIANARIPVPSATLLGGVKSLASVAHQFLTQIGTDGSVSQAQAAFSDISGSVAASQMPALTGDVTTSAGAVATTLATVNANVGTFGDASHVAVHTVNAKGLITATSNVTITPSAIGLGSVTNDVQTKAAIVPNTTPTAGQILVGNAGGTAYAPASASGDATLSSAGAIALATVNSNVGTFGNATAVATHTVDGKGRITATSNTAIAIPVAQISDGTTLGRGLVNGTTQAANIVLAGPVSGSATAPTMRALVQADTQAAESPNRNALSPRSGVALDGTASNRIYSTLTNQSLGIDAFSWTITLKIPAANPAINMDLIAIQGGTGAGGPSGSTAHQTYLLTSGSMQFYLRGATSSDYNNATLSNVVANYGGKVISLAFVRPASGNPSVYINGVAQTLSFGTNGTPPTWQGSITSTYLIVGGQNSEESATTFYCASLYNLALAASDVQEIFELGGAVPERFKFGSQAELINATADRDMSGANNWVTFNSGTVSVSGGTLHIGNASPNNGARLPSLAVGNGSIPPATQKMYRLRCTVINASANTVQIRGHNSTIGAVLTFLSNVGNGTYDVIAGPNAGSLGNFGTLICDVASGSGASYELDNVSFLQVGAVAHLALDDGVGYQAGDSSTNALDGVITTTGVTHVLPKSRGVLHYVTTTSGNQQILGQQALPANSRIMSWAINASGSSTVSLGNASAGTQFLNAGSVTSGLNDVTLITRFDSTNNLWVSSNNTNTLTHTIFYETIR